MSIRYEIDTDQISIATRAMPIRIHVTLTRVEEMREVEDGKETTTFTREVVGSWTLNPDEEGE